ncbi:hypothetical protein [Nonomuraea soli]|uniref:Uncharacterized protein n=1 Tax=Nonomuraea soli TaxID=1032476 RepID=A0A7W0CF76_9ACTN|nr:hypothetical protein [Nonomuraea soli]MBA2890043.1 hypothetical protein [Nonomuraea soli]
MRLTWKDAVATISAAAVVAVYVMFLTGADVPIVDSVRGATGTILFLGMVGGCAMSRADVPKGAYTVLTGMLGTVALLAAAVALIADAEIALLVFVVATLALWAVATVRHAATPMVKV